MGSGSFRQRDTRRAKALRNEATPAERRLWLRISNRQLGYKFSRQMPVGQYFVDFLCREAKLIIEIDGYSHDVRIQHDLQRTAFLKAEGYAILRFTNADVLERLEGVVIRIGQALAAGVEAHPRPLPQTGGEEEE